MTRPGPAIFALVALLATPLLAQNEAYPFGVGERFQYSAKLGFLRLGTGTIQVAGVDTVRSVPSFIFRFSLVGGNILYRINSVLESRTGIADFRSRRFTQDNNENGRIFQRHYDIYPDSGFYRLEGSPDPQPTVDRPLDDAAFLYFVRSFPLEVGRTYELDYYFRKEKNPLRITVEKREQMELPDGTKVGCLVVRPVMGDRGMFAERSDARIWLTDDARRIPVQIRTRYPFGTVILRLEEMALVSPTPRPVGAR
ncbi:MAG: DUF3108 domain-containing protein [Gemmatimonadota bacterium]